MNETPDENQIIAERRATLAALRVAGPAFPNDFQRTHLADELHVKYGARERGKLAQENIEVAVAGDGAGKEAHDEFKRCDIGDIVAARGVGSSR